MKKQIAFLSVPIIETSFPMVSSSAGEAHACRRRDLSFSSNICYRKLPFFLRSWLFFQSLFQTFQTSRTIFILLMSDAASSLCDGSRRRIPGIPLPLQPPPTSHNSESTQAKPSKSSSASLFKTAICFTCFITLHIQPGSGSLPPEDFPHQISLMARDLTLGPSVAPCPVDSSTAHDALLFWMAVLSPETSEISWLPTCASLDKDERCLSITLVFPRSLGRPTVINHRNSTPTAFKGGD